MAKFEHEAKERVPSFRQGRDEPCCYRCLSCWPIKGMWTCVKHQLIFGDISRQEAYEYMIRYVCDDYARGKKIEG